MPYTLRNKRRDSQRSLLKTIFNEIEKSLEEREILAKVAVAAAATQSSSIEDRKDTYPDTVWTLGRSMWEDGGEHLPNRWRNEVVPKVLNLSTVPTMNCYKALMRQIQGGVVSSMPNFEFLHPDYGVAQKLDDEWRKFASRSRLMGEIDSLVEDGLNSGIGYMGFTGRNGELCGVSADPQMVIWLPIDASRYQDIDAIFMVRSKYVGKREEGNQPLINKARWPQYFADQTSREEYEIRVECWIRPGAKIGDLQFEDDGLHAEIQSDNKVIFEEPYNLDRVPLVPVTLSPTKQMLGYAMSTELWQSQVRIDKLLAKLLWCAQGAGADKWRIDTSVANKTQEGVVAALNMTEAASPENQLRNGGIAVVMAGQGQIEKFPSEMSIQELHAQFEAAKRDMEYLAGISQPYQGLEPARVTAGVAINALVRESSKRVQRMGMFLAEGLREYALTWAKFMLSSWGQDEEGTDVIVSLVPQEENTKRQQVETLKEIADMVVKFATASPAMMGMMELLVDMIPGLTIDQKAKLREIIAQSQEQINAMQQQLPEGQGGNAPPASEEPVWDETALQGQSMPMMEEPAGAGLPLPNAPAVIP